MMRKFKAALEWIAIIIGLVQPLIPTILLVYIAIYAYLNTGIYNIINNPEQSYYLMLILITGIAIFSVSNTILIVALVVLNGKFKKLLRVSQHFRAVAADNAACDRQLFHNLFIKTNNHIMESNNNIIELLIHKVRPQVFASKQLCYSNIEQIFTRASTIFTQLTGDHCSVTLKVLKQDMIVCVRRDQANRIIRSNRLDDGHKVSDNTAFSDIIEKNLPYYINNDLLRSEKRREYYNVRSDWNTYYNASLVFPFVVNIDDVEYKYFLCIDNHKGGFSGAGVIDAAAELCERLNVMNHRLLSLEAIIRQT